MAAEAVVIGGGLAGISAAVALTAAGRRVTLVEKRATLGGRAGSFHAKGHREALDSSQHVLMGCCTNQLDLYERLGIANLITWHERLPLQAADGSRGVFSRWPLPPPLHLLPGLAALPGLSVLDRAVLAAAFGRIALANRRRDALDHLSFAQWLGRWTTPRLDRTFWRLMLTSVLNAQSWEVSARYGLLFFVDGLLRHADSFVLGVPQVPLEALHHDAVVAWLAGHGGTVHLRRTARVQPTAAGPRVWLDGEPLPADEVVVAVRWEQLGRVLPRTVARGLAGEALDALRPEAIIGVHLWFDEPVLDVPVLGLLEHDLDWVLSFEGGRRLSIVGSAAASWARLTSVEMKDRALAALGGILGPLPAPARWAACREGEATFVPAPGLEKQRPGQRTRYPGLALAGAWTRTGWPATQEGAVRSGYLAAEALTGQRALVADLPPQGLMRLLLTS